MPLQNLYLRLLFLDHRKGANYVYHVDLSPVTDRLDDLRHIWQQSGQGIQTCHRPYLPAMQSGGTE